MLGLPSVCSRGVRPDYTKGCDAVVTNKTVHRGAAVFCAGAIAISSLAACSSGSEPAGGGEKTITIGMNSGLVETFESYAAAFEETHEGWTIEVESVPNAQPDYIQQLVTQGLSKTTPDIIFNYDSLNQTLVGNNLLFDLKPWLDEGKNGMSGSDFLANFLAQYEVGDQITGIPVSADSSMLFYNADIFEQYGVEAPSSEWTTEDMYDAAREITEKSAGETYGIMTPIGDSSAYFAFYPMLKAFGGEIYDAESNKFVFADDNGLEAWTQMLLPYTEGFGSPYSARQDDLKYFSSGQVAMLAAARPTATTFRETVQSDWNVQQMPTVNGESTTGGGSYALSISADSDNTEGAYEFLSWFYSTDGGMELAQANGVVPATKSGLSEGTWKDDTTSVPTNLVPVTEYAVTNAILPSAIPDAVQPKVVPALTAALEKVVVNQMSVEEAYTAAQDELNGLLD